MRVLGDNGLYLSLKKVRELVQMAVYNVYDSLLLPVLWTVSSVVVDIPLV